MTNFELVLTIDNTSLSRLRAARQSVLLTRLVDNVPGGVIWLSLEPEWTIEVQIGSDYFLYAVQGWPWPGSLIVPGTPAPADFGKLYHLDTGTMQFSSPEAGGPPDGFAVQVEDSYGGDSSIGLMQAAMVTHLLMPATPLSTMPIDPGGFRPLTLTPTPEVVVAVAPRMQAGTYHPEPLPNATSVKLDPAQPYQRLVYEPSSRRFVPDS